MSRTDHHVPARFRREARPRAQTTFSRGRGANTLSAYANGLERRARAELRTFAVLIRRTHRSGGDIEAFTEPDARTRHRGHWDFW